MIMDAERKRRASFDESQMVDEMFGFIDGDTDNLLNDKGPNAFQVLHHLITYDAIPPKTSFANLNSINLCNPSKQCSTS